MKKIFPILLLFLVGPSCDWIKSAFVNTLPIKGNPTKNPVVHVFLAVDGLPYSAVLEAKKRGAFSEPSWKLAKFISMFPGTSDASWTRILHTEPLNGYEYTYYDVKKDAIMNKGYTGLVMHVVPALVDGMSMEGPYLKAFDFHSNGYTHMIGVYHDTFENYAESLDNMFFTLEGKAETKDTFSAYLLEIDAMGHVFQKEDMLEAIRVLSKKIEEFKAKHPERQFKFTLLSDHGIDFVKVDSSNLVEFPKEMAKVGVEPVEKLTGQDPEHSVYAIPIDHVRLTYYAFHTAPSLTEEVASRLSQLPFVDVTVGKLVSHGGPGEWYGIWENGKIALSFGYFPDTNQYLVGDGNVQRFGLDAGGRYSDENLFKKMKDAHYPDLFYRVRTSLSPVGIKNPANVLASLKPGYAALGFTLPGGDKDFSLAGFHGSLLDIGALGTLLTEEKEIPDAVRSDDFLEMFPEFRRNIEEKHVSLFDGDPNAMLRYR